MNAEKLLQEAHAYAEQLSQYRRYLHAHPGIGFDIPETVAFVQQKLKELGYTPQACGKAGLTATVGKQGKTFLLRADMDALPMEEESKLAFASRNGNMHACGHDFHTAMLLGAAKLLKDHEADLCGTVKLMFQPAEEIFQGARDMIGHGVLEQVDAAMMIHVMAGLPLPSGTVLVSPPGVSAPAADYFEIRVRGVGCHGSMPNTGVDPLTAAAHILIALQEIQARELSLSDRAVLTIGSFHGGTASNAIPDQAVLGGTIRTFDEDVRSRLKARLVEIAQGVAAVFRASAEVTFGSGCPTLVNDGALSKAVGGYMKDLLGDQNIPSMGGQGSGSEDFAYVSQQVPSLMLALAAGRPEDGFPYPQHHPKVTFDETVLPIGSAVYAYAAMRWLAE